MVACRRTALWLGPLLLALALGPAGVQGAANTVVTELLSSWPATPLLLEATELAAQFGGGNAGFWEFLALVDAGPHTDRHVYDAAMAAASMLLPPISRDAFQMALQARSASPAVVAAFQIAEEQLLVSQPSAASACAQSAEPFVLMPGHVICSATDLEKVTATTGTDKNGDPLTIYDVDHVYPGGATNASTPAAVLYVCLARVEPSVFRAWHQGLLALAEQGSVTYVLRHHCPAPDVSMPAAPPMRLSGYGVELAVKKTEYTAVDDTKIDAQTQTQLHEEDGNGTDDDYAGFRFSELQRLYPEHTQQLQQLRQHLGANAAVITPLKKWELQDLAMQAASRVAVSPQPLATLLHTSENFPVLAAQLARETVNNSLQKAVVSNQRILSQGGLEEGGALVTINSLLLDPARLDLHNLLAILRREARALDRLSAIGLTTAQATDVLRAMPPAPGGLGDEAASFKLDMRSSAVVYFNNLEKDKRYRRWSRSLTDILRPAMPGQMRFVAKNMFTAVLVVDVSQPDFADQLVALQTLAIDRNLPVRFGVVLMTTEDGPPGVRPDTVYHFGPDSSYAADAATAARLHERSAASALIRGFSVLLEDSHSAAFGWLMTLAQHLVKGGAPLSVELVQQSLQRESIEWSDLAGLKHVKFQAQGYAFVYGRGVDTHMPCLLFNGRLLPRLDEPTLMAAMNEGLPTLQRAAYYGELSDSANILNFLMTQPGVVTRLSPWTKAAAAPQPLRRPDQADSLALTYLTKPAATAAARAAMKPLTLWVVADLGTSTGQRAAFEALRRQLKGSVTRVALVHSGSVTAPVARTVQAMVTVLQPEAALEAVGHYLAQVMSQTSQDDALAGAVPATAERLAVATAAAGEAVRLELVAQSAFAGRVVGVGANETSLVVNQQRLGPFAQAPVVSDMRALESLHGKLAKTLSPILSKAVGPATASTPVARAERLSDMFMRTSALLGELSKESGTTRRLPANFYKGLKAVVTAPGPGSQPAADAMHHEVMAVLDPLSKEAQVVTPYLELLASLPSVRVRLVLNPKSKVSDLPLNRFFRTVLPRMTFDADGQLTRGPAAVFTDMPAAPLLTLGMHTPSSWMVQAVHAVYDLDNIHLETATRGVRGVFELEYILIEGNCITADTRQPTAGLQFQSGSLLRQRTFDTIVMANLGYFQLKAQPGAWHMGLRPGRSRDLYEIVAADGPDSHSDLQRPVVVLTDFLGRFLQFQVRPRPGMEGHKLLDEGQPDQSQATTTTTTTTSTANADMAGHGTEGKSSSSGWLAYLYDKVRGTPSPPTAGVGSASLASDEPNIGEGSAVAASATSRTGETINIFSLASGHLYERFLKIMMLSVFKNTRNPVKFWFLKNCMSPNFMAFLPFMAKKYGFEYELVQYNWPSWLNSQSEKQRLIWGYKILFLDVLFPLDVKKFIFVDADQVVRTDLKELLDFDLEGAVYGYTPFCNSRAEMDGFRFWNSGYWKSHLAGRPYHISALYVVDLVRFRQFAAGDRLRGQYQGLSRDPNSLSNLDQDLPNNMIHQVPIKSLPQDWLWCETWCSDASKASAKTIDLCNNPLTKEPKLKAAVRIVAEWRDLDWEAGNITQQYLHAATSTTTSLPPAETAAGEKGAGEGEGWAATVGHAEL